jgi:hypothetical protein
MMLLLKGHILTKKVLIIPLMIDLVQSKVRQHFLNF